MVESSQTGISFKHGPGAPSAPDLLRCGGWGTRSGPIKRATPCTEGTERGPKVEW